MNKLHQLYDLYIQSNKKDLGFIHFFDDTANSAYIARHINEQRSEDQQTLLHLAVIEEDLEIINLLFNNKADVTQQDKWGKTPLYRALEGDKINVPVVKILLDHGANINEKDPLRATALHWSVLAGNLQKTSDLISLGSDVNVINRNHETPLRWALTRDIQKSEEHIKEKMVQLLFQKSPVISQDFTGIIVPPGITDNIIMIGSTKLKELSPIAESVTRKMQPFAHAITTIEEFDMAIKDGLQFDYPAIELATKNSNNSELQKLHERAKFYHMANEGVGIPEVKHNLIHSIALLWLFSDSSSKRTIEAKILSLPEELQDLIIDDSLQESIRLPELVHIFAHNLAELWSASNEHNKKYIDLKISLMPSASELQNIFSEEKKIILEYKSQARRRS